MMFTGETYTDDEPRIFKSITIEDSSEPLPYEPGVPTRTFGTKTLRIEAADGVVLGLGDIDYVVIGGNTFRREGAKVINEIRWEDCAGVGEKTILSVLKKNRRTIRGILGIGGPK